MPIDLNIPDQHGDLLPDLNILLDQHGELLPNLNEAPAYEQEDAIPRLQEHQLYEDEAPLPDQHRELLPDLNELAYEEEDEISHPQDHQLHEDEAHLQEGQPLHLHHDKLLSMHVIGLNVDASEGEQEHHEGDLFLLIASGPVRIMYLQLIFILELNIVPHLVAVIGVEEEHPQHACLNFDGPHKFDLNFQPSDLQQQMHQDHSKLTTT
jgi:hypothetical protein